MKNYRMKILFVILVKVIGKILNVLALTWREQATEFDKNNSPIVTYDSNLFKEPSGTSNM